MATRKSLRQLEIQLGAIKSHSRASESRKRKATIAYQEYVRNIKNNQNYIDDDNYEHRTGQDYNDDRPSQTKAYEYRKKVGGRTSLNRIRKSVISDSSTMAKANSVS